MWAASFETTWNIFFKMEETRLYDSVLSTPLEVLDLVLAEVAWAATRATIYGTVFTIIVALFGLVDSALGDHDAGLPGARRRLLRDARPRVHALITTMDWYSFYYTLFITPLFLFSGIFYPLDGLPGWVSVVAWFTPLYHLVEITRGLVLGPDALSLLGNVALAARSHGRPLRVPARALRRRLVA